jgi:hypothetical protein
MNIGARQPKFVMKHFSFLTALLLASLVAAAQTAQVAPAAMADLPVTELTYPRHVRTQNGLLVVYAPQIEAWPDYQRVTGRSAIEVTLAGSSTPAPGSFTFDGDTKTDLAERVVGFFNLRVTGLAFPGADDATAKKLDAFVRAALDPSPKKVPLDLVLAYLADSIVPQGAQGLAFDPPRIFYSSKPAVLVVLDGAPVKVPIKGIGLSYAANTNWDLFWLGAESRWFLLSGSQWLVSRDQNLDGKWKPTDELPIDFRSLPAEDNWKDVRAKIPPPETKQKTPAVFVSEKPAEIIITDGRPDFENIEGLELRYATDTTSDLFLLDETYYYLVSGRWFSTRDLKDGSWLPVNRLPDAFAGIPKNHAKARVRVAVPGTDEARLAALEAAIPRTATIQAGSAPQIKVVYNGAPEFEPIPGTTLARAVNTPFDVIRYGAAFYLCYNATWYVADGPDGPWRVARKVPDEIYKIPPSSPAYHVTHVRVYANDDNTVTTGYTGGYYGVYSTGTTIVYGTGWYYPPYVYYGAYPYYYYYPVSYGRGTWYNPTTGMYGGAEAVYGPYGGAGRAAVYNPETGSYARGRAMWDDDEMAGQAIGYNPRTGTGVATNRYRSEDAYWGETMVRRGDDWVYTQSDWQDGSGTTDFATSRGTTGTITGERQGDTIKTESTINRGGETITGQGEWSREGGSGSFESSSGASGTVNRAFGEGQVTGSGTITQGDKSATTEMIRTEQGVVREFTTGSGESITTARARGSDDLYAAKDGEVYKRTDEGWQKYGSGGWEFIDRSGSAAAGGTDNAQRSRTAFEEQGRQAAAAAGRTASTQQLPSQREMGAGTSQSSREVAGSRDMERTRSLDRDYRARQDGYSRFSERRSAGGAMRGSRGGGRRR